MTTSAYWVLTVDSADMDYVTEPSWQPCELISIILSLLDKKSSLKRLRSSAKVTHQAGSQSSGPFRLFICFFPL